MSNLRAREMRRGRVDERDYRHRVLDESKTKYVAKRSSPIDFLDQEGKPLSVAHEILGQFAGVIIILRTAHISHYECTFSSSQRLGIWEVKKILITHLQFRLDREIERPTRIRAIPDR